MAGPRLTRGVDRDDFIARLEETWQGAAPRAGGAEDHDFDIAGAVVRLRFAGPALVGPLTAALAHARREAAATRPDLTVLAWDAESTGASMPPAPWGREDFGPHGRIRGFFDAEVQATYGWGSSSFGLVQPRRGTGLFWARSASAFPFFERAAPLRTMLHGWAADRGLQLVHAGALAGPAGCVLLAGPSGAGKSSVALACLASQIGHLADDYCLIEDGEPPVIHALYSSVKAHPDTLERIPVAAVTVSNPVREPGDKAVMFLHETIPERLVARAPLRAVAIPRIAPGSATRVSPATRAQALAALAPSTLLQLPGSGADALRRVAALVRAVPCVHLDVGSDPRAVPEIVETLVT